jgi:DNA polymerase-3 subunit delta
MLYQEGISSLKFKRDNKFFLIGDEPYLKNRFIKAAISLYSNWEILNFYPDSEKEALSSLNSGGLFEGRLIILNSFNKMDAKRFINFSDFTQDCIIFVIDEDNKKTSRDMTTIISKTSVIECNRMKEYGNDYSLWISSIINGNNYTKRDGVEAHIYNKVGPNMFSLHNEISKLLIYKSDTRDINIEDVSSVVSLTSVRSSFELLDNLLNNNIVEALRCLDSYSRVQDNYVELVSFLYTYMEKMYRILLLRDEKVPPNDIASIVGIPRFLLTTRYLPKALAFGKNFIMEKINYICDLEVQLRKFKGNKRILIERLLFKFSK